MVSGEYLSGKISEIVNFYSAFIGETPADIAYTPSIIFKMIHERDKEVLFCSWFGRWEARKAPLMPCKLWEHVYHMMNRCSSIPEFSYQLRSTGLHDFAVLTESDFIFDAYKILEKRKKIGWEIICSYDESKFPVLMRERLGMHCPPVLWKKGENDCFSLPAIAVVGSRNLNPEEEKFAFQAGELLANLYIVVISGAAKGADSLSVFGALAKNGKGVHFLPGGKEGRMPKASAYITENTGAKGFERYSALRRNRWIYASGECAIVVSSRFGEGGAWHGALEAFRRKICPIAVYIGEEPSSGNDALMRLGATPVRNIEELKCFVENAINTRSIFNHDKKDFACSAYKNSLKSRYRKSAYENSIHYAA